VFWWDGDAVAGDAQRCRRAAESINQRCPAFPHASAFAWQTGRCRVRAGSPRVRGFCLYRRRYGNSQHEPEPDRVPVRLFPATSLLGVCAARLNAATSTAINSMPLSGASGPSGGRLLRMSLERGVRVVIRMHNAWFDFCRD
jgi:hypothetical protein